MSAIAVAAMLASSMFSQQSAPAQQLNLRVVPQVQSQLVLPTREQLRSVQVDSILRELAGQLDDEDYRVRERASRELVERAADKMQLFAMLIDESLSTEQRYRLMYVVRDFVMSAPRGALGIQMAQFNEAGQLGVRIDHLIPGMPAAQVLQVGDRIIQIDDAIIHQTGDLQVAVQNKRPGDRVRLVVQRPLPEAPDRFQTVVVQMQLGSFEQMDADGRMSSSLQLARQREAEAIMREYAPRAASVSVVGGLDQLYSMPQRNLPRDAAQLQAQGDQHPVIQKLLAQRQMIARGLLEETPALKREWETMLLEIYTLASNPEIDRAQRAELLRVIERFRQLMEE